MLTLISPAKSLDETTPPWSKTYSEPSLLNDSQTLLPDINKLSEKQLQKLMGLSDKLALLNHQRFQTMQFPFTPANAKQALFMFTGDVYKPIDVAHYSEKQFAFAQEHLRILSGFYGLLRPLDLIQPYRLEMGTKLQNSRGKDLYQFWGNIITQHLNNTDNQVIINLASNEYWQAVHPKKLTANVITPQFKDWKNDHYKMIGFFAKRARGEMVDYIIKEAITTPEALKDFNRMEYSYNPELSQDNNWVFTRRQK